MQGSSQRRAPARYPSASPQEHAGILSSYKGFSALPHCPFPPRSGFLSSTFKVAFLALEAAPSGHPSSRGQLQASFFPSITTDTSKWSTRSNKFTLFPPEPRLAMPFSTTKYIAGGSLCFQAVLLQHPYSGGRAPRTVLSLPALTTGPSLFSRHLS